MPGKIKYIPTKDLYFDPENPRFFRLNDSSSVEAVIEEMLDDEGAQDLMLSIGQKGYFEGEPLLVAKTSDSRLIVVEGNRRLAATKLLNRELEPPKRRINSIESIRAEAVVTPPTELPCIEYPERKDVLRYLGYRHITGVKEWDSLSKAKYLAQLRDDFYAQEPREKQLKSLANEIGSKPSYVGKLLTALAMYTLAENSKFFGLPMSAENVEFSYLTTALNYNPIVTWLGLESGTDADMLGLNEVNLKRAFSWMFPKDQQGRTILGESRNLGDMASIVQSEAAIKVLEDTGRLDEAYLYTNGPQEALLKALDDASQKLRVIWNMLPGIRPLTNVQSDMAQSLSDDARDIRNYIRDKREDD
ncbi:ParB N-terminal domain-containing protein [Dechloromonas denitrificans]|uniref:ParB N-terminal domain-containing protein n=1 Tax=Dechloromonas denitrificans TaxID=281362 RepID=UPI001CFB2254|nr:ParB N-terminal domain-containing protein [Dechloromonas denitrificans]UCV09414.1 ParB N-terminal domain-containing protein [Dechloromonas denitrificans]